MNKVLSILVIGLFVSSGLLAAERTLTKKRQDIQRSAPIEKKKKPSGCKAFGDAIRNIRTVKELQRELNNHSEETIKKCIEKFRNNRRIMNLFEQLNKLNKGG